MYVGGGGKSLDSIGCNDRRLLLSPIKTAMLRYALCGYNKIICVVFVFPGKSGLCSLSFDPVMF